MKKWPPASKRDIVPHLTDTWASSWWLQRTFYALGFSQPLTSTHEQRTLFLTYEDWTAVAAWCDADTNKHLCCPQIHAPHLVSWEAAVHLARVSPAHVKRVRPTTWNSKNRISGIYFPVFPQRVMLDVADSETSLSAARCCGSTESRPQASRDRGLSHLHSSEAAGCNSKIITSSAVSRKTWCECHVHDSSLQGKQLNQHFKAIYHQLVVFVFAAWKQQGSRRYQLNDGR